MIGVGNGVRVYLACGVTDMRKGISSQAALAQDVLRQNPTSGALFAFRSRRGDRIKLLMWDGQGFRLYYTVEGSNAVCRKSSIPPMISGHCCIPLTGYGMDRVLLLPVLKSCANC